MDKKEFKKEKDTQKYYDTEPNFRDFRAVSNQDCTGLIPANPQDNEQLDSYMETYDYRAKSSHESE